MFKNDFVWGVASSAYQVEGRAEDDKAGRCVWDTFCDEGRVYEGQNAKVTCDHIHRYREDYALMKNLGIKAYRFSLNWARILPDGIGEVNEKAIELYRDMILSMKENGITPYITLFHWEYPEKLFEKGGWLNDESPEWFGYYAKVVAERLGDLCDNFFTINEPQCAIGLGHLSGVHAPGVKFPVRDTFKMAHNLLKAHGTAVKVLRETIDRKINIGYAPTCGVAYPYTDDPKDIEAAKKVYFGFYNPVSNWTWNVSWFSDPVFLGHYPKEGLEKYAEYLPDFSEEDMELIHQPLDFMGQNIYNGYYVRAGEDGEPEFVTRAMGFPKTAIGWPVTPKALYYALKFLYEKYKLPIYITENGMSCHDIVSEDGMVHDPNRINFLDTYIGEMQRAVSEGVDVRGYFLWTFVDNFEWADGYKERFGIVYVDFITQKRTVKDSAFWYKKLIETNGGILTCNNTRKEILFLNPVCTHNIWGGTKLRTEFGYDVKGDDIGECWGISAHPNGDGSIKNGKYAGMKLSKLWEEHPEIFGNVGGDRFPLLTKIIDARDDLSIQVHPDDEYAKVNENGSLGKTECWYIMDCPENATIVVGHNAKTDEELRSMINEGRWNEFIRQVPVKKGDFIQINPGTVHAIKGGILILETQQNSDITYRVYDYDRLSDGKPRQLHVRQSIDVINVPAAPVSDSVMHTDDIEPNKLNLLYSCKYYKVFKLDVNKNVELNVVAGASSDCLSDCSSDYLSDCPFLLCSVLEGYGIVDSHPVKKGDHFIIPNGYGKLDICGDLSFIISTVPNK